MSQALQINLRLPRQAFTLQAQLDLPLQGVTVLWGASGSGKTSLLRSVAGLERAEGRVALGDALWQDDAQQRFLPPWQRRLGMVFQEASLFEHLDVQGNLHYGLRRLPHSAQAGAQQALAQAIEVLGIGHLLQRRSASLSGGERQRVGLARALLAPARLWLIDEPLSALDPTRSRQAIGTLVQEARDRGVTLVSTLHQVEVALAHFPRVLGLRDGRLAFDLPPAQITRERLERLYAQHEDELRGAPLAPADEPEAGPRPATMHCR